MKQSHRIETEAKFIIPSASVFEDLLKVRRLGDFELKPIGMQTMVDYYLDTADKHLYQAGYACRIRNIREKKILGLKALTPPEGMVHRREEYEAEIESYEPKSWPDGTVKQMVLDIIGAHPLKILFAIHQNRHKFSATTNGRQIIEFSLDEVSLNDSGTVDHYSLEAELLEGGQDSDLTRFVEALQAQFLLRPDNLSKYERGLASISHDIQAKRKHISGMLREADRQILIDLAKHKNKHIARRAAIVLMSDANIPTTDIARDLQLTGRTVRYWRQQFQKKGLSIFPEKLLNRAALQSAKKSAPVSEQSGTPLASRKPSSKNVSQKEKDVALVYPVRKKIGLTPTDTMAEAGRKVIGFHFARMLKHEKGARLGEDIEELHAMRVAVRRMRAALKIFQPAYTGKMVKLLQKGLKATTKALGPARDLDVFMEKLTAYSKTLPEKERGGLEPLLENCRANRNDARKKMIAYLDSNKYAQFKKNMLVFVKTKGAGARPVPRGEPVPYQLRHLVPQLVYGRYATVCAYETILDNASIDTLHDLRLAFKAFRYTLEFFREILGPEVKAALTEIKKMQDHLGDLNDTNVAIELLRRQLIEWDNYQMHLPLTDRKSPTALIKYLTHNTEERHRLIMTFPKAWASFNGPEFRRNLALSIAAL